MKSDLRGWLAEMNDRPFCEMKACEATLNSASDRILVFVGGLHSVEHATQQVALKIFEQAKFPCHVFRYPNDGSIRESGEQLRQELVKLHQQFPTVKMSLVTHSMGGLVARYAVEGPVASNNSDEGQGTSPQIGCQGMDWIDQMLMVCSPNTGSEIARFSRPLEGMEQMSRLLAKFDVASPFPSQGDNPSTSVRPLLGAIIDGLGEATVDLQPNSELLQEMATFQRCPNIKYSIIAGDQGPLNPWVSMLLVQSVEQLQRRFPTDEFVRDAMVRLVQCEELRRGVGDGVVSVDSMRLNGVTDFELMPIHHLTWSLLDAEANQALIDMVAKRINDHARN